MQTNIVVGVNRFLLSLYSSEDTDHIREREFLSADVNNADVLHRSEALTKVTRRPSNETEHHHPPFKLVLTKTGQNGGWECGGLQT